MRERERSERENDVEGKESRRRFFEPQQLESCDRSEKIVPAVGMSHGRTALQLLTGSSEQWEIEPGETAGNAVELAQPQAAYCPRATTAEGKPPLRSKPLAHQRRAKDRPQFIFPSAMEVRNTLLQRKATTTKAENKTGLPDRLKSGIERLSGYDLSGVRVNYNSAKAAQLNAHAYTRGQTIEVGPGQERHLPHEAWHVVQQMQGRVKPTIEVNGYGVNDERHLEHEAEVMGKRAVQRQASESGIGEGIVRPNVSIPYAHGRIGTRLKRHQPGGKVPTTPEHAWKRRKTVQRDPNATAKPTTHKAEHGDELGNATHFPGPDEWLDTAQREELRQGFTLGEDEKDGFIRQLQEAITLMVDDELEHVGGSSKDCPYIEYWFNLYEGRDVQTVNKALHKYHPQIKTAEAAEQVIELLVERVRRGLIANLADGDLSAVPEDVPTDLEEAGEVPEPLDGEETLQMHANTVQLCRVSKNKKRKVSQGNVPNAEEPVWAEVERARKWIDQVSARGGYEKAYRQAAQEKKVEEYKKARDMNMKVLAQWHRFMKVTKGYDKKENLALYKKASAVRDDYHKVGPELSKEERRADPEIVAQWEKLIAEVEAVKMDKDLAKIAVNHKIFGVYQNSSTDYDDINGTLRDAAYIGKKKREKVVEMIMKLQRQVVKAKKYEGKKRTDAKKADGGGEQKYLYRGTKGIFFGGIKKESLEVGKIYREHGFTSTSKEELQAGVFASGEEGAMIRITRYSSGVELPDRREDKGGGEGEVLFPAGSFFKYLGVNTDQPGSQSDGEDRVGGQGRSGAGMKTYYDYEEVSRADHRKL